MKAMMADNEVMKSKPLASCTKMSDRGDHE